MPGLQIRRHRSQVSDVSIFGANRAAPPMRVSATEEPESPQEGTGGAGLVLSHRVPHLLRSLGTHTVHGGCEHTMLQQHVGHGQRQWLMLPVQFGRFPRWLPASCPRRVMAFPPRHDARDAGATIAHPRQRAARPPAARMSVGEPSPGSHSSCTVLPGRTVGRAHRPNARSVQVHSAATRVAPHITMPSPPHIPLACRAHQSECGRTPLARGRHQGGT